MPNLLARLLAALGGIQDADHSTDETSDDETSDKITCILHDSLLSADVANPSRSAGEPPTPIWTSGGLVEPMGNTSVWGDDTIVEGSRQKIFGQFVVLAAPNRTAGQDACPAVPIHCARYNYFVAGAAGAAAGAAGAPGAGAGVASGAGAGAGAAAGAGFCSSAFLQPTTAEDNVTKKSRERIMAKTFFIQCHLLPVQFSIAILCRFNQRRGERYSFFWPCQEFFLII
jgi:hypothetical protein